MNYNQHDEDPKNQKKEDEKMNDERIKGFHNLCQRIVYLFVNKYVPKEEEDILCVLTPWGELKHQACTNPSMVGFLYAAANHDSNFLQSNYLFCIKKFYHLVMTYGKSFNRSKLPPNIPEKCPWTIKELYTLSVGDLVKKLPDITYHDKDGEVIAKERINNIKKAINTAYGTGVGATIAAGRTKCECDKHKKSDKKSDKKSKESYRKTVCLMALEEIVFQLEFLISHKELFGNPDAMKTILRSAKANQNIIEYTLGGDSSKKKFKIFSYLHDQYYKKYNSRHRAFFPIMTSNPDPLSGVSFKEILTEDIQKLAIRSIKADELINILKKHSAKGVGIPMSLVFPISPDK